MSSLKQTEANRLNAQKSTGPRTTAGRAVSRFNALKSGIDAEAEVIPGKFLALNRTWKNGDRIQFEIGMPLRLEPVDDQTPNTVALLRGPIALFAVGEIPPKFTRSQLLAATAASQSSSDFTVRGDVRGDVQSHARSVTLRPFAAIGDETYRLYHQVEA